ncbi:MAG TPA: MFS transporter, partial [Labilithrix sp.]|nr:MFS transporter [Labilithrix sp.]
MKPWRAVAMLAIWETVAWGVLYYSFGVLLRPFAAHLAASEAAVAGAFSVALLSSAGAAWIAGRSVDRRGPRLVMTVGALLGVAAFASLGAVDTIVGFYIAWAAIGVSHAGVLYEPAFAAIAKWFPSPGPRAGALLAVTTVAGFASTIFVPMTASLHEHLGRQRTVLVLAALVGITALPLNAALPRHRTSTTVPSRRRGGMAATPSPHLASLTVVFSLQAFASAG